MSPLEKNPYQGPDEQELLKRSLAKDGLEVFSEASSKRLLIMREIFDSLPANTHLNVIRRSSGNKRDVLLRNSDMNIIDAVGSNDTVTPVSDKAITGNKNGYSYIHRTVKIDGKDVNKIYVKVKTSTGKTGYLAIEHIGGAVETKPTPPPVEPQKTEVKKVETKPTPPPVVKSESAKEKQSSITTISTLPSGLKIAKGNDQGLHPLISKGNMVDMVITFEGPGGQRQADTGRTFDIGGGINTDGPELERRYAFPLEKYENWNSNFIPVEEVRGAVSKTLEARIALTYESCKKHNIDFDSLPLFAQKVLVDLHYNMNSIRNGFPKFWKAIGEKNWKEAGKQLMDSGNGNPNNYLNDVYTRAYANAMMLSQENPNGAEEYKNAASKILNGTLNTQLLYDAYFEKTGKYGDRVGYFEKRKILQEIHTTEEFISKILSDDVLRADKKSTTTILSMIDKYLKENNNKNTFILELQKRLGNFDGFLDTGEKIAAYQSYVYLIDSARFKNGVGYIDGQYGQRTKNNFLQDAFLHGDWEKKIEGDSGILTKTPLEIKNFIKNLSVFEKSVLSHRYEKFFNISEKSAETDIKKAQFVLCLSGKDIGVDGKWSGELKDILGYSENAKKLADFVQNNYSKYNSGKNSCGASVGKLLAAFGLRGLPTSGRNGENWNEFLDARTPEEFIKIPIGNPSEARPGGMLCYDDGGVGGAAVKWGHVEIKGTDNAYYHYLRNEKWGGSRGQDVENSNFTGYVYYPRDIA